MTRHDRRWCIHYELGADLIDGRRTCLPHDHSELVEDDLEHFIDTVLAKRAKTPHVGATDPHRVGAEGKGFEDICAPYEHRCQ